MWSFFWILILVCTFLFMEFVAWFSHKYIMHGFLWSWHRDHHKKDHNSWFEKNDLFFLVYAIPSMLFVILFSFLIFPAQQKKTRLFLRGGFR